jgi:hypothetical protein
MTLFELLAKQYGTPKIYDRYQSATLGSYVVAFSETNNEEYLYLYNIEEHPKSHTVIKYMIAVRDTKAYYFDTLQEALKFIARNSYNDPI